MSWPRQTSRQVSARFVEGKYVAHGWRSRTVADEILERLATGEMPPQGGTSSGSGDATRKMIIWLEESLRQAGSESTITRELAFPAKGNTVDTRTCFSATPRAVCPGAIHASRRISPFGYQGTVSQLTHRNIAAKGPIKVPGRPLRACQRSWVSRLRLPLQSRQLRNRTDGDECQEDRGADAQDAYQVRTPQAITLAKGAANRETDPGCRRLHVREHGPVAGADQ